MTELEEQETSPVSTVSKGGIQVRVWEQAGWSLGICEQDGHVEPLGFGSPGAAPAGGHVRAWPQAYLVAEKRADSTLGPHGSLTITCVLILPDQVRGVCRQQ